MLRNKELQDFYSSENSISMIVSRMVKKTDHASRRGVIRIEVNIFIGKPKKEKPFKRSRSWRDMLLTYAGCGLNSTAPG
jgi:hypothetical protein